MMSARLWGAVLEAEWQGFEQGGWEYLLPDGRGRRWLCVDVLEGATAAYLAPLCAELHVVAGRPGEAAPIESRCLLLDASNVVIHRDALPAAAPDGRGFDGFILHDLRGSLDDEARGRWIAAGRAALAADGFLFVTSRNRHSYTRLRSPGRATGSTPGAVLRQCGAAAPSLLPFICDEDGRLLDVIAPTGYVSAKNPARVGERLRRLLLGPRGARRFASGFGVLARAGTTPPTLLEAVIAETQARGVLEAGATFRRYHVLRGGKAIVSLGGAGRGFGRVIAVIARGREAIARRDREFGMLARLAAFPPEISSRVPRVYFRTDVAGTPAYLMEELAGITLDAPVPQLGQATREAIRFVTALHGATRREVAFDEARFAELCEPLLEEARKRYPPLADVVGRMGDYLRAALVGRRLPLVWMHGDFKVENAIIEPGTSRLVGVIDWEHTEPEGFPFVDLWYLLIYNGAIEDGLDFFPLAATLVPDGRLAGPWGVACDEYAAALGVPREAIPGLVAAFVVHHIGRRVFYSPRDAHRMTQIRSLLERILEWRQ